MAFKKISELVRNVDGWLSEGEAKYLYALARFGPGQGAVVEIGSWKGKSTIVLASGSAAADRETVYAIDPHKGGPDQESIGLTGVDTEAEFRRNIKSAGVDSRVVPMVTHSTEAAKNWDQPVRLLWIDGDHSYDAVKNDFLSWEPFVIGGGIIAFHDTYSWDGPSRLVEEYFLTSDRFTLIGFVDTITAVKKRPPSFLEKLRAVLLLAVRRLYILGRKHLLPGEIRKWSKAALRSLSKIQ